MTRPAAVFLALWTVPTHLGAQAITASSDSARLQGTWVMVSGTASGTAMPPVFLGGMRRVLTGNELTVTQNERPFMSARIVLNSHATPKTIDYHMTGGFTAGAVQLGIYEIRGDTVTFCFGPANGPRPAEFTSVAGDGRTLSTWVRATSPPR